MERCNFLHNSSVLWKWGMVSLKYLPTPSVYKHGFRGAADLEHGEKVGNLRMGWLKKGPEIEPYRNSSKLMNCRKLC